VSLMSRLMLRVNSAKMDETTEKNFLTFIKPENIQRFQLLLDFDPCYDL
jgi:hypothetical protein